MNKFSSQITMFAFLAGYRDCLVRLAIPEQYLFVGFEVLKDFFNNNSILGSCRVWSYSFNVVCESLKDKN